MNGYPEGVSSRLETFVVGFVVTALALMALAVWAVPHGTAHVPLLIAPTAILAAGGIGAFAITYRSWRAGREWRWWQGAGWALFVMMSLYAAMSAGSLLRPY
jgi:hypothetical protein